MTENIIKETDLRESLRVVTSNEFFKALGLENLTLKARKFLYLSFAQCKLTDNKFEEQSIKAREFAEWMGISPSHVYEEADKITDELMKGFIKYVPEGKKAFAKCQLYDRCAYSEDAVIYYKLSDDMAPILLALKKNFTKPLLEDFAKMNSPFSMEVWHLMQREMNSRKPYGNTVIEFYLSVEELRFVTGTQNTMKQIGQFKEKVLDKAIREILENCNVKITYENVKQRNTIIGFHFTATSVHYIEEEKLTVEMQKKIEKIQKNS